MNPEVLFTRDALTQGEITAKNGEECESHQLQILSNELKELIKREAKV